MNRGFTLIELLIVVAIIAILAAIAVPNFLEAQVRSKTARVKSDLRTLALSEEAYLVDNNKTSPDFVDAEALFGMAAKQYERAYCYHMLTTPIAYITTTLRDPFAVFVQNDSGTGNREELKYYYYVSCYKTGITRTDNQRDNQKRRGYLYGMYSVGPVGKERAPWLEEMLEGTNNATTLASYAGQIYDPTNGTTSYGRIIRTNKGYMGAEELKQ